MKKYYKAYEERYKQVHKERLLWVNKEPTEEFVRWVKINKIPRSEEILEMGCGEGKDAIFLGKQNYSIFAVDVSKTAIKKCIELSKELSIKWKIADLLKYVPNKKFKWIYSISVLHMFVMDEDRAKFLKNLYKNLVKKGKAFILIKGDGKTEFHTDISKAFENANRMHWETKKEMQLATTSYRAVKWEYFKNELTQAGFKIIKTKDCIDKHQGKSMIAYLEKN